MASALTWLVRRATLILAVGVFAGLVFPSMAAVLRPLLPVAVWGLLLLAMLRLDWRGVIRHLRRPVATASVVVWLLLAVPVVTFVTANALGIPPGLTAALVLMAAAPPIVSSPALAILMGLDAAQAMLAMTIATMLMPLTLPILALELLSLPLDITAGALMIDLALFIGSALAVATLVRFMLGRQQINDVAPGIDALAIVFLLLFAIAIMDGIADKLLADPGHVGMIIAVAFAANTLLQVAGGLAFVWLGRRPALTVGFVSGNRNMALLLAVLPASIHADVLLYFALGQIPIYVMLAVLTPIYRRLLSEGT